MMMSPCWISSSPPVSTSRMSSTAMANSVFWIMLLSRSWGSEISRSPSSMGSAGYRSAFWPEMLVREPEPRTVNMKRSFMAMSMSPSDRRRTTSLNSLPGTMPRPSSSTSASMRVVMVMRSSEQVRTTPSSSVSISTPSNIGLVVRPGSARTTICNPSISAEAVHLNRILKTSHWSPPRNGAAAPRGH